MEKALFIARAGHLNCFKDAYTRVYFGNEFCERLIPSIQDLGTVLDFVCRKKVGFTLVTPYVTDTGLQKVARLLGWLTKHAVSCEVIVNDWGVLRLINASYGGLEPVLGRLLTKQKRGPGIARLLKRNVPAKCWVVKSPINPGVKELVFLKPLPAGMDAYYKGSNVSSVPVIHDFLRSQRVKRIELDNTEQGLLLQLPKDTIRASVYLPYVYISTTFFCLTAGCAKKPGILKIKPCAQECRKVTFELRHKSMPRVLYLKGNTQFYRNEETRLGEWEKLGVDRIVHEPEIPM